jgi:hypothetical protein
VTDLEKSLMLMKLVLHVGENVNEIGVRIGENVNEEHVEENVNEIVVHL